MSTHPDFTTQKRFAYKRMLLGGAVGGVSSCMFAYWLACSSGNLNPVAGLGILVVTAIGCVVGALCGTISRKWNDDTE